MVITFNAIIMTACNYPVISEGNKLTAEIVKGVDEI